MWIISLPLRVPISKKKKFPLNLNHYRNAHYRDLSRAKNKFTELVLDKLQHLPEMEGCLLEYVLYPATRQRCDVSNVCSVIDKFFSDTLVTCNRLEDDNYKLVPKVKYTFGAVDPNNPRCDVIIRPLDSKGNPLSSPKSLSPEPRKEVPPMQIKTVVSLSKENLMEALKQYLEPHVTISEGSTIEMGTVAKDGSVEVTISSGLTQTRKSRSTSQSASQPTVEAAPKAQEKAEKAETPEKASPEPQEAKKEVAAPTPSPAPKSPSRSLFQNLTKVTNE